MSKRRSLFLVFSIPLLFLLLFGGIAAFYLLANPITAQVSIQPATRNLRNAMMLTVVPGQPDALQQQIGGARLLSATLTQTMTQTATGKGHAQATSASGIVEMIAHFAYGYATEYAGTVLTGDDGITIVSDQTATAYLDAGGIAYFHAHVATPGAHGNIPAYAFHTIDHGGTYISTEFYNVTPFTGGQDAGPFTFVKPNDVHLGEQTITTGTTLATRAALTAKRSASEQWATTPFCTQHATADATPGKRVESFHVTATVSCTGEVYDTQRAKTAAIQQLTARADNELGENYQLSGEIATTITSIQVAEKQHGTLNISLFAQGTWVYHFTNAQKQHLVQLISGKGIADAQKLLLQQDHIEHATITLMHSFWFWNTIPTDVAKITFTIQEENA